MSIGGKESVPLDRPTTVDELSELHDGRLVSISLTGGTLELGCESLSGERMCIRMKSLYRMRADRFLQGNIIFSVRAHGVSEADLKEFRRALTVTDDEKLPDEWFAREFADAQREQWQMLVLESSYGCELVAISKDTAVQIRRTER